MLDPLFNPKAVAVIGASSKELSIGNRIIRNLVEFGFKGDVYPINPKVDNVRGVKAYRSILDVPDGVDVVHMPIPAASVPQVMEECGRKGVKFVILNGGGFAETGPDGAAIEEECMAKAKEYGMKDLRTQLPGCYQHGFRIEGILQLYLHQAGARGRLPCCPERRRRRTASPDAASDGRGDEDVRV